MAQFTYKAKQGPKKIIEGVIEADSVDSAVAKIIQQGYSPIDVKGRAPAPVSKGGTGVSVFASFLNRVPQGEVVLFIRQMSDLIGAGVPVMRSLEITGKQCRHAGFKDMVEKMYVSVKDGAPLSSAMEQFPGVFPKLYVNMIRSGEVSGNLNVVLNRLGDYAEKDQETRAQIRSSLVYPALIVVVGAVTIFVLFTRVVPEITTIFEDMDEALPVPTQILMAISFFLSHYWWVLFGGAAILGGYVYQLSQTEQGRLTIDGIKLRIPFFGQFIRDAEIARFARTLGTLLDNGVVILTALESVGSLIQNTILRKDIAEVIERVRNGDSLSRALQTTTLVPETAVSMITVGEETGQVYDGLYRLADFYERQCQRVVKTMTSLIEPVLILVLGSVVGFVVISILMPIFKMNLMIK